MMMMMMMMLLLLPVGVEVDTVLRNEGKAMGKDVVE
jgi:hypothetical protein